ncbi:MAG: hypothetical protein MUC50_14880 [Myxococcota bacterium]|jgi:hypothetical protein|nr:hypothetical protein [Myxococcota bacterium]
MTKFSIPVSDQTGKECVLTIGISLRGALRMALGNASTEGGTLIIAQSQLCFSSSYSKVEVTQTQE